MAWARHIEGDGTRRRLVAIGLGTYLGGWRVIRTLGKGLVEIESPQGLAAEASSAAIILSSSAAGMALSTTHVATGSILGSGVGKPGAQVRWAVAGRMAVAWLITLPAAALVGALSYWLSYLIKDVTGSRLAGDGVIFVILVALSFFMWWRAQQQKVDSSNVNADWDTSTNSVVPAEVRDAAKTNTKIKINININNSRRTKKNVARDNERNYTSQSQPPFISMLTYLFIFLDDYYYYYGYIHYE